MVDAPMMSAGLQKVADHQRSQNPKTSHGKKKVQVQLVPPVSIAYCAAAMADGVEKYEPYSWRDSEIFAMEYIGAAMRHLHAFQDREDNAPDSGVHHLGHAMASIAILIDGLECGTCIDDRPTAGPAPAFQERVKKE